MAGPARNQPCPCGSGVKYKKCCDRGDPSRAPTGRGPTYRLGDERDPSYRRALERRAAWAGETVQIRAGVGGPELVFAYSFDQALTAAIERLPGRRFQAAQRAWTVPARRGTALAVAALLEDHPSLSLTPEVEAWLEESLVTWTGCVSVIEHEREPALVVHPHSGEPPAELVASSLVHGSDLLLLRCDPATAGLIAQTADVRPDGPASAALGSMARGERPCGASLTVGADDEGLPRFELRTDWLFSGAAAFARLPEAAVVAERDEDCLFQAQADILAAPADAALVKELRSLLQRFPDLRPDKRAGELLARLEAERARAQSTIALSLAHEAELDADGLGGELRPFQRAAVSYALRQRRTFLADEQGLGKTVEALGALHLDGAFPALVVCPASMKHVWRQECGRWLPQRRVAVVEGRSADGWELAGAATADIVVCNYDIIEAHADRAGARGLRAAVFDESHYCKDPRRKRTRAAIAVADRVADDGLRLALTGTPILNRPRDLVSQLRLIGRLGDFGSGAGLGRRFKGPAALERLHWHLRAHCYVRRLKTDVLPQLPAKRLATVPLGLSNEREYRLAEADVVAWLHTLPLDLRALNARVAAALRAEQLARLNYLRQLAARGKLATALSWTEDFVASGEPLVVFAHHRDVQRALLERFPAAAHVLGEDDPGARARAVQRFQDPDGPGLIICSLQSGSQGITLTRASNVAFLELDWTPARHDQAEDRCHRIGQRDAVTAYYLLAPDTIDEHMATILHRKRGVIGAITDGRAPATDTTLDAVVRALRERSPAGALAQAA